MSQLLNLFQCLNCDSTAVLALERDPADGSHMLRCINCLTGWKPDPQLTEYPHEDDEICCPEEYDQQTLLDRTLYAAAYAEARFALDENSVTTTDAIANRIYVTDITKYDHQHLEELVQQLREAIQDMQKPAFKLPEELGLEQMLDDFGLEDEATDNDAEVMQDTTDEV